MRATMTSIKVLCCIGFALLSLVCVSLSCIFTFAVVITDPTSLMFWLSICYIVFSAIVCVGCASCFEDSADKWMLACIAYFAAPIVLVIICTIYMYETDEAHIKSLCNFAWTDVPLTPDATHVSCSTCVYRTYTDEGPICCVIGELVFDDQVADCIYRNADKSITVKAGDYQDAHDTERRC